MAELRHRFAPRTPKQPVWPVERRRTQRHNLMRLASAKCAFTTAPVVPHLLASLSSPKGSGPGTPPKASRGLWPWTRATLPTPRRSMSHVDTLACGLKGTPLLPDLHCAWFILTMFAALRAEHLLRTVPPDLFAFTPVARTCQNDAVWHSASSWASPTTKIRKSLPHRTCTITGTIRHVSNGRRRATVFRTRRCCCVHLGCVGRPFARTSAALS